MFKAVIFDFDGLLVDTEIVSYRIYKELLEPLGYVFTIKPTFPPNYNVVSA